ncbi:sensor histidine kinase [Bacillus licheniformis]|uniref:sensor histidine kinase n=1 Tax=Bacillus licheniformis TaxID=1402 RepID=UPI001F14DD81|nr:histidine kinase [Bacillus licheniformis]
MKNVQNGDFKLAPLTRAPLDRQDEVSVLNRNFFTMVERINELIAENYKKQLMLKETEFKALQAQINPHFLYNTLESINWLAKTNRQPQISTKRLGSQTGFCSTPSTQRNMYSLNRHGSIR